MNILNRRKPRKNINAKFDISNILQWVRVITIGDKFVPSIRDTS